MKICSKYGYISKLQQLYFARAKRVARIVGICNTYMELQLFKYATNFCLHNVLCNLDFKYFMSREKNKICYCYFIASVLCSRSIYLQVKHPLCAFRVCHKVNKLKESLKYIKYLIGNLVTSKKNLFEPKLCQKTLQHQVGLQDIK